SPRATLISADDAGHRPVPARRRSELLGGDFLEPVPERRDGIHRQVGLNSAVHATVPNLLPTARRASRPATYGRAGKPAPHVSSARTRAARPPPPSLVKEDSSRRCQSARALNSVVSF